MTESPQTYRLLELRVENVKKISVVNIRPEGPMVVITGENGNGKTAVLDALDWLFEGKRAMTKGGQTDPIRSGQQTATIRGDLGDIKVTRTFTRTEDGSFTNTIKVVGADGSRYKKEEEVLKALVGDLAFDPIAFSRLPTDEQFSAVTALVPGIDFHALKSADDRDFDERTDVNRQAKALRAQAEGISVPAGSSKRVDTAALEAKLGEAAAHNTSIESRKGSREAARSGAHDKKERATALRCQAARLIEEALGLEKAAEETLRKLADAEALPEPIDVSRVQADLAAGRAANAVADALDRRTALETQAADLEARSKALTDAMDARETERQQAIAAAKMPVPGLSFGAGEVLLNGHPFAQASRAEQWMAAVAIAGALNPRLRVVRILDGSLLDDATMTALEKMAEAMDLQVWIERVGSGGVGFELEDGHLKGEAPPTPAEEEAIG